MIANAQVQAKNTETGVVYRGTSTRTPATTLSSSLPLNAHEVSVANSSGIPRSTHSPENISLIAGPGAPRGHFTSS